VWHELRQFGATILDPVLVEEAQLVCDEMARRARHNISLIVERLGNDGYRFHSNDDAQTPAPAFVRATAGAGEHADWLQRTFGPLPMTVLSWGETTMPLVVYLNWVFRNGGFPGPTASASQWRVKQALAKDLLPP